MAWIVLVAAGLMEIAFATALKHSAGLTRVWPAALAASSGIVSFVMLAWSLRHLPIGTAYAVWVGIGVVGVAATGIVALNEPASPLRLCFLVLIVIGVIGLRVIDG